MKAEAVTPEVTEKIIQKANHASAFNQDSHGESINTALTIGVFII